MRHTRQTWTLTEDRLKLIELGFHLYHVLVDSSLYEHAKSWDDEQCSDMLADMIRRIKIMGLLNDA